MYEWNTTRGRKPKVDGTALLFNSSMILIPRQLYIQAVRVREKSASDRLNKRKSDDLGNDHICFNHRVKRLFRCWTRHQNGSYGDYVGGFEGIDLVWSDYSLPRDCKSPSKYSRQDCMDVRGISRQCSVLMQYYGVANGDEKTRPRTVGPACNS